MSDPKDPKRGRKESEKTPPDAASAKTPRQAVEEGWTADPEEIFPKSPQQTGQTDAAAGDDAEATDLAQRLQRAEALVAVRREESMRLRAEMENLRKRTAREIENGRKFALERFAHELLGVADSLDLGAAALRETSDPDALREGMELTRKQFFAALKKFAIEPVEAAGQRFDPALHEALAALPHAELPPNRVVEVVQAGYTLNGRLLRAARVLVSAPPPVDPADAADGDISSAVEETTKKSAAEG